MEQNSIQLDALDFSSGARVGDVDRERCENSSTGVGLCESWMCRMWRRMLRKQGNKMSECVKALATKPESLS